MKDMHNIYSNPLYADDFGGMEEYDMLAEVYANGQSYVNECLWDHLSEYFPDPHVENYIRTTRKTIISNQHIA